MDNLFEPISNEELENLKKQIKELEQTLRILKQRLEFYETNNIGPRMYQGGMISPADLEQAHVPILQYNISQSNSTNDNTKLKYNYDKLTEAY